MLSSISSLKYQNASCTFFFKSLHKHYLEPVFCQIFIDFWCDWILQKWYRVYNAYYRHQAGRCERPQNKSKSFSFLKLMVNENEKSVHIFNTYSWIFILSFIFVFSNMQLSPISDCDQSKALQGKFNSFSKTCIDIPLLNQLLAEPTLNKDIKRLPHFKYADGYLNMAFLDIDGYVKFYVQLIIKWCIKIIHFNKTEKPPSFAYAKSCAWSLEIKCPKMI